MMKYVDNMKIIDKRKKKIIAVVAALFFGSYVLAFFLCTFSNASSWNLRSVI